MDIKVNGIVLSATNYKEKDVLVSIFTAELGKITAVLKGARGAKAKLKFATQPFCFGEWVLCQTGDRFTVLSCSQENSFFELTCDYNKYTLGCAMLHMCSYVLRPNIFAEDLLVLLLKALTCLLYDDMDMCLVFAKFMLDFASRIGYGFAWDKCGNCGCALIGDIKYSFTNRTLTCPVCAGSMALDVHKRVYSTLKILSSTPFDKLNTVRALPEVAINCIHICRTHLENVIGLKLNMLDNLI